MVNTKMNTTNQKLIKIIHELVRRSYYCLFATNEPRVISEGGLITASKTYIKSAIIVADELEPLNDKEREMLKETMKMLEEIVNITNKKSNKFDLSKDHVRKKINKVKYTANWLLNKLKKKMIE